MSAAPQTRGARGAATVARLLDAAAGILCSHGAAAVSVQRVAEAAGTSKALVHYHFTGKDALLIACIERLASQLERVEGDALARSQPASAVRDLWEASMASPARGWRRALLSLTTDATPALEAALSNASVVRHRAATKIVARLDELGLAPSLPDGTLAVAYLALVDGLTLTPAGPGARQRQAFDAFWLAMLSLDA